MQFQHSLKLLQILKSPLKSTAGKCKFVAAPSRGEAHDNRHHSQHQAGGLLLASMEQKFYVLEPFADHGRVPRDSTWVNNKSLHEAAGSRTDSKNRRQKERQVWHIHSPQLRQRLDCTFDRMKLLWLCNVHMTIENLLTCTVLCISQPWVRAWRKTSLTKDQRSVAMSDAPLQAQEESRKWCKASESQVHEHSSNWEKQLN
jgi:hypothetical protein